MDLPELKERMRPRYPVLACVFALCLTGAARADLPLTVEDLITDKGKVKLDLSLAYANSDRQGVSTGDPISIQIGPTAFVTLPTVIGETRGNSDAVAATLGLRYGLSAKAEIYARLTTLYLASRDSDLTGFSNNEDSRFADAWAGLNYQFKEDDDTPALLGFVEVALREKHTQDSASFKSWLFGLTTYRAIDPVVLSLSAAYRLNHDRRDGSAEFKPGNLLLLNPSVGFAVNDRVTLTTGLQWTSRQADRLDGEAQGLRRTATDLLFGVGYGLSHDSTLNLTAKANVSGSDGAELRFNWLHTF